MAKLSRIHLTNVLTIDLQSRLCELRTEHFVSTLLKVSYLQNVFLVSSKQFHLAYHIVELPLNYSQSCSVSKETIDLMVPILLYFFRPKRPSGNCLPY